MWRRRRFDDVVRRQLDLFAIDESLLLDEASAADSAWTNASVDDAEELYGEYQLVVDAIGDRLYDIRETYARSLDDATVDEYRAAFDKAARRRLGRLAQSLEELE
jgi:hypothetical protein